MKAFVLLFENESGKQITHILNNCPCIEDATIEGSNIAEDNGY